MAKLTDIAKAAEEYYRKGNFKPDVLPGCANFVSHCMQKAGGNLGIISYVPHLVDRCEVIPSTKFQTGDLVVFKQTYDAVAPAGIGKEDNMTHIGVMVSDGFIDFGGSPASVRKQPLTGFWRDHIDFFMRPPGFDSGGNSSEIPNSSIKTAKVFANDNGKTLVINGKSEDTHQIGLYAIGKNDSFVLDCNWGNDFPVLETRSGGKAKVLSLEVIVKYILVP